MTTPSSSDADDPTDTHAGLWPSADYHGQVERLRAAVGETIYLAELRDTETQLGVLDFPRPDPVRGLAPHLVLLDDGRGVNLGRIARISRRPFQPAADEVLYLDHAADRTLLFADRRLSKHFIAERAHAALGQVLGTGGPRPPRRLANSAEQTPDDPECDNEAPAGRF
jgi:hypothetical protein